VVYGARPGPAFGLVESTTLHTNGQHPPVATRASLNRIEMGRRIPRFRCQPIARCHEPRSSELKHVLRIARNEYPVMRSRACKRRAGAHDEQSSRTSHHGRSSHSRGHPPASYALDYSNTTICYEFHERISDRIVSPTIVSIVVGSLARRPAVLRIATTKAAIPRNASAATYGIPKPAGYARPFACAYG